MRSGFWGLVVLNGIGAGLGADALMFLLRAVQHAAFDYHTGNFLAGVQRTDGVHRVVVLTGAGVFAGTAWWVLRRYSRHEGHSLSESVWQRAGRMPFGATLVNAALQMTVVGLGVSLGREGAPKEAGAAWASRLASWRDLDDTQRRVLVACGAGAGMAAVYNVPLGGALFALEVLLGSLSLPLVLPALTTSFIATAVAWIYLPTGPSYAVPHYAVAPPEVVWALLAGPLCGLLAVGYIRLIRWAKRAKPTGWALIPWETAVFAALGALAIVYPQLLGNGRDAAELAFTGSLSVGLLAVLVLLKPLATAGCLRAGAVGGLFTPTLTTGALAGGLLGHAWSVLWPGAPAVPIGVYAVIGAAAVLSASMQAPLAAVTLVLELTDHTEAILVPLLIAVVSALLVARALDGRSIYTPLTAPPDPPAQSAPPDPPSRPCPPDSPAQSRPPDPPSRPGPGDAGATGRG